MDQEIKKCILQCLLQSQINYHKAKDIIYYIFCYRYVYIGEAELRNYINELRNEGNLIIASNKGYKLSKDREEVAKYLKSRWCEVCKEMKTFKTMAYASNFTDEQMKLWENDNESEIK